MHCITLNWLRLSSPKNFTLEITIIESLVYQNYYFSMIETSVSSNYCIFVSNSDTTVDNQRNELLTKSFELLEINSKVQW